MKTKAFPDNSPIRIKLIINDQIIQQVGYFNCLENNTGSDYKRYVKQIPDDRLYF